MNLFYNYFEEWDVEFLKNESLEDAVIRWKELGFLHGIASKNKEVYMAKIFNQTLNFILSIKKNGMFYGNKLLIEKNIVNKISFDQNTYPAGVFVVLRRIVENCKKYKDYEKVNVVDVVKEFCWAFENSNSYILSIARYIDLLRKYQNIDTEAEFMFKFCDDYIKNKLYLEP